MLTLLPSAACSVCRRNLTSRVPQRRRERVKRKGLSSHLGHPRQTVPPQRLSALRNTATAPGSAARLPCPLNAASPGTGQRRSCDSGSGRPGRTPRPPSDRRAEGTGGAASPAPCKQAARPRHQPSEVRRQNGFTSSAKLRLFLRVSFSASSLHSAATKGTNESWMNSCTDCTHWAIASATLGPEPAPPPSSALLRLALSASPFSVRLPLLPCGSRCGHLWRQGGRGALSSRPAPPCCASAEPSGSARSRQPPRPLM